MANVNVGIESKIDQGVEMEIALDFTGWQPGGVTSDLVRDGQYAVQVVDVAPMKKKGDGGGVNARIVFKVTAPNCEFKGRQLVVYHPIPIGDSTSGDNQKRRFLHNLFYSIISGMRGEGAAEALKGAGVRTLKLGWFVGKTAWIKARETTDLQARPVGEVQFYITKVQYESSPGPFGAASDDVDLSKSAATAIADAPATNAAPAPAPAPVAAPAPAPASSNPVDDLLGA